LVYATDEKEALHLAELLEGFNEPSVIVGEQSKAVSQ
jgi:hypothetical protein